MALGALCVAVCWRADVPCYQPTSLGLGVGSSRLLLQPSCPTGAQEWAQ